MRPFVYALAGLNLTWSLVSVWGILARPASLTFWTQSLMASLLLTVFVAPALVYVHARTAASSERTPDPASQTSSQAPSPAPPRSSSTGRWVGILGISGLLVIWLFGSLFALFFDPARIGMWTQSLMWSFVGMMLWVPVLVFAFNPLRSSTSAAPAETASGDVEPFIPPSAHPTLDPESETAPPSTDSSFTDSPPTTPGIPEQDAAPETPYEGPPRYRRPLRSQIPSGTPAPSETNAPSEASTFYYPTNPPPSPSSTPNPPSRAEDTNDEDDIKWPDDD